MPIEPTNVFSLPIDSKHQVTILPNDNPNWRHGIYRNFIQNDISIMARLAVNGGQSKSAERFLLGDKKDLEGYFKDIELVNNPNEHTRKVLDLINKLAAM